MLKLWSKRCAFSVGDYGTCFSTAKKTHGPIWLQHHPSSLPLSARLWTDPHSPRGSAERQASKTLRVWGEERPSLDPAPTPGGCSSELNSHSLIQRVPNPSPVTCQSQRRRFLLPLQQAVVFFSDLSLTSLQSLWISKPLQAANVTVMPWPDSAMFTSQPATFTSLLQTGPRLPLRFLCHYLPLSSKSGHPPTPTAFSGAHSQYTAEKRPEMRSCCSQANKDPQCPGRRVVPAWTVAGSMNSVTKAHKFCPVGVGSNCNFPSPKSTLFQVYSLQIALFLANVLEVLGAGPCDPFASVTVGRLSQPQDMANTHAVVRARSHKTRKHICMQICVQTLWCCLQAVWTLPFTTMCFIIWCACCEVLRVLCERGLRHSQKP